MINNQKESTKKQLDETTNWIEVLNSIKQKKFSDDYDNYTVKMRELGYLIEKGEMKIYLFKHKKKINIFLEPNIVKEIEIYSTLEIENFIKLNKKDINYLYIKNEKKKYVNIIENFGHYIKYNNFEIRKKSPLSTLKFKEPLEPQNDYTPKEYSDYFYDYFIYEEDEKEESKKIIFENSNIRNRISDNIIELRTKKYLKTFKFTGPTSIGKSLTLFRLAHVSFNIAYLNLKTLSKSEKDLYKAYSIVISELERFNILVDKENEINGIINKNYYDENSYLILLLNIMEYLSKLNENFVFILDQFKNKYIFEPGFLEKIKSYENIKLVQCSSINNKNIRDECIKTWSLIGKKLLYLEKNNQDYYFYFTKLYNNKKKNDDSNIIFKQISYIPKYIKKFKKHNYIKSKFLNDIKNHIDGKITEFCEDTKIEKSNLLSHLKYIIKNEYSYDEFSSVIQYIPLKYFIIIFKSDNFKIKPIFPFMKNIINYKLKETECDNYFKNKIYEKNTIENKYVKGDYFEAATKFGLLKINLPENKDYKIVTLKEIVLMDSIIEENETEEYEEEEELESDLNTENDEDLNTINNKKKNENIIEMENNIETEKTTKEDELIGEIQEKLIQSEDEEIKEEEKEGDDNDDDNDDDNNNNNDNDDDINEETDNKNDIKQDEEKTEDIVTNLDEMLKKFDLDNKNNNEDIFDKKGLSFKTLLLTLTIEDYRKFEIIEQKEKYIKKDTPIEKSGFNGDESIFLDQFSKWGKALDFAYIYGKKNEKIFVGFQMKCFFENSDLNNNAIDKCWIRKSCQKILVNSMKLFNCKIVKWHYYIIFYYNFSNSKTNVNINNLNKCRSNHICYFFYDPERKQFRDKKFAIMNELLIKDNSNLDSNVTEIREISFHKLFSITETIKAMQNFINDFSKLFGEKNQILDIIIILEKIKNNLKIKQKLAFFTQYKIMNIFLRPPLKKEILLFKMKNSENFIAVFHKDKDKKIRLFNVSTGKGIKGKLFKWFDDRSKYYYSLHEQPSGKRTQLDEIEKEIEINDNKEKIIWI